MKEKLTAEFVSKLRHPGGKSKAVYVWDTEMTGFGVKLIPSGNNTYVLDYRFEGKHPRISLGKLNDITLAMARKCAKEKLGMLSLGIDPNPAPVVPVEVKTFSLLCSDFIERHAKPRKKTWGEDQRRIDKYLLPKFGKRAIDSITRIEVEKFYEKIPAPVEANRVLALLSKMFDLAERWGYVPPNHPNPARKITKNPERKRDRWVTPVELPVLAEAIDAEQSILVRAGLWLYLLTGLRNRELMKRSWSDLNRDSRILRLDDTKSGRPFYLPLSSAALEILEAIPVFENSPWIFPGANPAHHLTQFPRKAWLRVRERAGMPDLRIHDLRRTAGSLLATSGEPLLMIGKALNQSTQATTEVYAHLAQDTLAEMLERHGSNVVSLANVKKLNGISQR